MQWSKKKKKIIISYYNTYQAVDGQKLKNRNIIHNEESR
jgi:hypothetical protein